MEGLSHVSASPDGFAIQVEMEEVVQTVGGLRAFLAANEVPDSATFGTYRGHEGMLFINYDRTHPGDQRTR